MLLWRGQKSGIARVRGMARLQVSQNVRQLVRLRTGGLDREMDLSKSQCEDRMRVLEAEIALEKIKLGRASWLQRTFGFNKKPT